MKKNGLIRKHILLLVVVLSYLVLMVQTFIHEFWVNYLFFDIYYTQGDSVGDLRNEINFFTLKLRICLTVFIILFPVFYYIKNRNHNGSTLQQNKIISDKNVIQNKLK